MHAISFYAARWCIFLFIAGGLTLSAHFKLTPLYKTIIVAILFAALLVLFFILRKQLISASLTISAPDL